MKIRNALLSFAGAAILSFIPTFFLGSAQPETTAYALSCPVEVPYHWAGTARLASSSENHRTLAAAQQQAWNRYAALTNDDKSGICVRMANTSQSDWPACPAECPRSYGINPGLPYALQDEPWIECNDFKDPIDGTVYYYCDVKGTISCNVFHLCKAA
jgi:hypothetical protein